MSESGIDGRLRAQIHEVKCWPEYFQPIVQGLKRFELRLNDRNYHVGDCLVLCEFDPNAQRYSGEQFAVRVLWMMPVHGLSDYVLMSIEPWVKEEAEARPAVPPQEGFTVTAAPSAFTRASGDLYSVPLITTPWNGPPDSPATRNSGAGSVWDTSTPIASTPPDANGSRVAPSGGDSEPSPVSGLSAEDETGLSIDMLDVDRLREWARLLLLHGPDIGHWGSVQYVAGKMQIMATCIEKAIRDIGKLRALTAPSGAQE